MAEPQGQQHQERISPPAVSPGQSPIQTGGPKLILIVAYYRSGSSLLGKLLDSYPEPDSSVAGGLYWFEPLVTLYRRYVKESGKPPSPVLNGYRMEG